MKMNETMKNTTGNNMQIFINKEFGSVRTVEKDNEVWFVAKDVTDILGCVNSRAQIKALVDDENRDKSNIAVNSGFGYTMTSVNIINESGLYSLLLDSAMPKAKLFKKWVTQEVLPAIRKTSGYIQALQDDADATIMSKALLIAQNTIENKNKLIDQQDQRIKELEPSAKAYAEFIDNEYLYSFSNTAKLLSNSFSQTIGRNRLMAALRDKKALNQDNSPAQRMIDRRLMCVKAIKTPNCGFVPTGYCTAKGVEYIKSRMIELGLVLPNESHGNDVL
jgi:prophage antirepressor-like protein